MSPLRRRKRRVEETTSPPEYLEAFLAESPDVGTSDADVAAVAEADVDRVAEEARLAQYVKTEEAFDRNAPRPSTRD
jgi:hypothetical protein